MTAYAFNLRARETAVQGLLGVHATPEQVETLCPRKQTNKQANKKHGEGTELALERLRVIARSLSQMAMVTYLHNGSEVPGKISNLSVPLPSNLS